MTDLMSKSFLFANPSFLSGMGRIMDLGSTLNRGPNNSPDEAMADYFAIKSDWHAVELILSPPLPNMGKKVKRRYRHWCRQGAAITTIRRPLK